MYKNLSSMASNPNWSQTEKSCIASNYNQFSTNIKIKIMKLIPVFLSWAFDRPLGAKITGFNLIIFHFDIRGKLSVIRCDKYILFLFYEGEIVCCNEGKPLWSCQSYKYNNKGGFLHNIITNTNILIHTHTISQVSKQYNYHMICNFKITTLEVFTFNNFS